MILSILWFFLSSVVVFVALPAGIMLGLIAKEELKQGKKYLLLFQSVLFALIVFFILELYKLHIVLVIIISIIFLFLSTRIKEKYIYPVLAVIFVVGIKKLDFFVIESALIFLYGLAAGSLLFLNSKCKIKKAFFGLLNYLSFLIISNGLFLVWLFFSG